VRGLLRGPPGKDAAVPVLAGASLDDGWVAKLELFFVVEEENFPEILLGIQTAQSILKDRLKMRIFAASEKRSGASL
jgi:hypothetical protein